MLNPTFARRLLPWATASLFTSLALIVCGALLAYGIAERSSFALEFVGHWLIALGAFGVKASYIARLAALDVLKPHPDGWRRESRPPKSLPPLGTGPVETPQPRRRRA